MRPVRLRGTLAIIAHQLIRIDDATLPPHHTTRAHTHTHTHTNTLTHTHTHTHTHTLFQWPATFIKTTLVRTAIGAVIPSLSLAYIIFAIAVSTESHPQLSASLSMNTVLLTIDSAHQLYTTTNSAQYPKPDTAFNLSICRCTTRSQCCLIVRPHPLCTA